MNKRTKKQTRKLISNILMIVIIVIAVVSGLLFAANQKGLLRDTQKGTNAYSVSVQNIRGEISILRNGISFFAKENDVLMQNDVVTSLNLSLCEIKFDSNSIYLSQNTKISIDNIVREQFSVNVLEGDISANIHQYKNAQFFACGKLVTIDNKTFSLNANGEYSNVFSTSEDTKQAGKTNDKPTTSKQSSKVLNQPSARPSKKPTSKSTTKSAKKTMEKLKVKSTTKSTKKNKKKPSVKSTKVPVAKPTAKPTKKPSNTCTIIIRCDSILSNMDKLATGKDKFVPKSGYLLKKTELTFKEDESAFDILKRVCEENNIPIEYSFTPGLETYYVEGINHLYEFDCGSTSGWLYDVNGKQPIRGSSDYIVQSGDHIDWHYSCSLGS